VRKNPNYAPIHNTAGLIQVALKNFNGAVKSFASARRLNSKFFEAHMNYGAVNLGFRGFGEAEKAYREALKLRPKEYEAHLGLALAIRGQIKPGDSARINDAQKHLEEAKKIAPDRAETYYNEAILTQEYRAKGEQKSAIPMLEKAAQQYRDFIAKAGSDPGFADAVKRAGERSKDIEDTVKFIKEGEASAAAAPPAPKTPAPKAPAPKK
jgi:tetratricopeptide (TPR) repeat protein